MLREGSLDSRLQPLGKSSGQYTNFLTQRLSRGWWIQQDLKVTHRQKVSKSTGYQISYSCHKHSSFSGLLYLIVFRNGQWVNYATHGIVFLMRNFLDYLKIISTVQTATFHVHYWHRYRVLKNCVYNVRPATLVQEKRNWSENFWSVFMKTQFSHSGRFSL